METITHKNQEELEAALDHLRLAPKESGILELLVCRPDLGQRKVLTTGQLDEQDGLLGDNWSTRGSRRTKDKQANPDQQINIMNSRAIDLIAGTKERWSLAGDQLFVSLNLSEENVPAGTRLTIGDCILEVTAVPHLGCKKFMDRFGKPAFMFVNSEVGKQLHLRGINAKIIQGGVINTGDTIEKVV